MGTCRTRMVEIYIIGAPLFNIVDGRVEWLVLRLAFLRSIQSRQSQVFRGLGRRVKWLVTGGLFVV
jgi:uncharacterized membrane protein